MYTNAVVSKSYTVLLKLLRNLPDAQILSVVLHNMQIRLNVWSWPLLSSV